MPGVQALVVDLADDQRGQVREENSSKITNTRQVTITGSTPSPDRDTPSTDLADLDAGPALQDADPEPGRARTGIWAARCLARWSRPGSLLTVAGFSSSAALAPLGPLRVAARKGGGLLPRRFCPAIAMRPVGAACRARGLLADAPDDHDWAALRHRRCSRLVVGEARVGRVVCDDNVTTDDLSAGQGVVAGLAGCAGCRTRAEMARRLVKRSLLGQGATRTPPSPAGRPRPACRA